MNGLYGLAMLGSILNAIMAYRINNLYALLAWICCALFCLSLIMEVVKARLKDKY